MKKIFIIFLILVLLASLFFVGYYAVKYFNEQDVPGQSTIVGGNNNGETNNGEGEILVIFFSPTTLEF